MQAGSSVSVRRQTQRLIHRIRARIAPDPLSIMSSERVEEMRPSRSCLLVRGPRLARLLSLVLFVGLSACGSPSPEAPRSDLTSGSAGAVVASLAGHAAGAGSVATDPHRPGSTATTRPSASNRDQAPSGASLTHDPRAAQSTSAPRPPTR